MLQGKLKLFLYNNYWELLGKFSTSQLLPDVQLTSYYWGPGFQLKSVEDATEDA